MNMISLFNNKGGVSKTTTTFNLGHMLANKGKRVLIVDADPQCNLTSLILGEKITHNANDFYKENILSDLYSGLSPILNGDFAQLQPCNPIEINDNLFLLCGNLHISILETQISVALQTSDAIPAIKKTPSTVNKLIRDTAKKYEIDYVLIDMSPSIGSLNHCLLMASDYFIVPTSPDYFCVQAINALSKVIPKWNEEINKFRVDENDFTFPKHPPQFLGFISQRYRPKSDIPAKAFKIWIDKIDTEVNEKLVPKLKEIKALRECDDYNMAQIPDFNSLIAISQKHNTPVFMLTEAQIGHRGKVLKAMLKNKDNFYTIFDKLTDDLIHQTE